MRCGYVLIAAAAASAGCAMPMDEPPPPPPRPIDACPAGGTLRVQVWDVYATPRRPDGDVWDGVSAGTYELVCAAAADYVRDAAGAAITAEIGPGAAGVIDELAGDAFEREVASLCGLATNWLQMAYEGPDLFALGGFDFDTEWRWRTRTVQDDWVARLDTTTTGAPAGWDVPCDSSGYVGVLGVYDEDLAFDDDVAVVGLQLSTIPDPAICDGWGYYPGVDGVAGILVRLQVLGATPQCG